MRSFTFTLVTAAFLLAGCSSSVRTSRTTEDFNKNWRFHLGEVENAQQPTMSDQDWRLLNVPHDWSVEGAFSKDNPAGTGGGALPGGIGWYRKTFTVPAADQGKRVYIAFDGVYWNSDVWINGQHLGKRPYGYSSFQYDLTPYLKYGAQNTIAVRVDNSQQPNSRWYSGSGIYRNVRLVTTGPVHVDHWGTYVTTPQVSPQQATVAIQTTVRNTENRNQAVTVRTTVRDASGRTVATATAPATVPGDTTATVSQQLTVSNPVLWSTDSPTLYTAVSEVLCGGKPCDQYETPFGIRTFNFDAATGFSLNGKPMKILGVCNHHDLGALGAAINTRALERQLEILRGMGVNGIRTSHNPPAPELLDLCDRMGFIVMDEAFDMWARHKTRNDYAGVWDQWHARDLTDLVLRDRNHPSVMIWSIGNEIPEQRSPNGGTIATELAGIVRSLDPTRPITAAINNVAPDNTIINSGALDLIGYNYAEERYQNFPKDYPGKKFIATETTSAIQTRGEYHMPSDVIRRLPERGQKPREDLMTSSYDNSSVPWGSTHEETWREIKRLPFASGMFIWTGFDYLGEPTPYPWPARSSYFGIVDLAGFPKDSYYMYKSEWTNEPVLHVFPHWNWTPGDTVDVWAYTNADEVELFLNGQSLGTKKKGPDDLHLMWRTVYQPGTIRAVARKDGKTFLEREVRTAGQAAKIELIPDRSTIKADGYDLSFVTVNILDANGNLVPKAENLVQFDVEGGATIAGVDNGSPISMESFKANHRKAFNGKALVILKAGEKPGRVRLRATSEGLAPAEVEIQVSGK